MSSGNMQSFLPQQFWPHANFTKYAISHARHESAPSRTPSRKRNRFSERLMNAGRQRSIHDEGNSHATTCAKTGGAKEGESVPDVYLTWAVLAVVATEAARKISNFRALDRRTRFDSHPRLHQIPDFYPPLKGSCVCAYDVPSSRGGIASCLALCISIELPDGRPDPFAWKHAKRFSISVAKLMSLWSWLTKS